MMGTETFSFKYQHYDAPDTLPEQDRELAARARAACSGSYAPFSKFRVGAAVRFEDGGIRVASNQESEVLPEGMCAERALLYFVQANDPGRRIEALAIASDPAVGECYPCGACRQVIAETQKRQQALIRVIMAGRDTVSVVEDARDLLPFTFNLE